jgi:hypothetical protein
MYSLEGQKSWRRNLLVGSAVVGALVVGVVLGSVSTSGTVEAQAGRTFSGGSGLMLNYVDAARASAFEGVVEKLAEGLQNSDNPERNRQAEGWKVYRAQEPGPNGTVLYVWVVDTVVPGADYSEAQLLFEAFPDEVQGLYETYTGALTGGQSMINLDILVDF